MTSLNTILMLSGMSLEEKKARDAARRRAAYAADPEKYKTQTRRYRQANPDKVNAAARSRYARGGEPARKRRTLEKYKLSQAEFNSMYEKQAGRCAICGKKLQRDGRRGVACIDHDHDTGKVRALLCRGCNIRVGYVEKDTALSIAAVEYVLKHTEVQLDTAHGAG